MQSAQLHLPCGQHRHRCSTRAFSAGPLHRGAPRRRPPRAPPCRSSHDGTNGALAPGPAASGSALTSSLQLAWCRAAETLTHLPLLQQQGSQESYADDAAQQQQQQGDASASGSSSAGVLVLDPYASALLGAPPDSGGQAPSVGGWSHDALQAHPQRCGALAQLLNLLSTRYIDDTLLNAMAATNLNSISKGDYRQVVLVGDAFDTRPYRLPWPEGTLLFLVAPRDVHQRAAERIKASGARVPRGCLLRRVPADLAVAPVGSDDVPSFLPALEAAGFQPDKLSVWSLQGLAGQALSVAAVHNLLTDVTGGAAFHSLVLGELPAILTRQEAESLLAEHGLLSAVMSLEDPAVDPAGRWTPELQEQHRRQAEQQAAGEGGQGRGGQRWLFTAQQLRLSYAQMGVYERHAAAAMEVDEDFTDNFS